MHVPCFLMCVLFYLSFIWLHVYAFAFKSKVHCGSASARCFQASLLLHTGAFLIVIWVLAVTVAAKHCKKEVCVMLSQLFGRVTGMVVLQTNKRTNNSTAGDLRAIVVARRFRATLVLHTIRMLCQRLVEVSGVAAIINKSKTKTVRLRFHSRTVCVRVVLAANSITLLFTQRRCSGPTWCV